MFLTHSPDDSHVSLGTSGPVEFNHLHPKHRYNFHLSVAMQPLLSHLQDEGLLFWGSCWLWKSAYSDGVGILSGSYTPVIFHWDGAYDHSMPGSSLSAELFLRMTTYLHSQTLFKRSQELLLFAPSLPMYPTAGFLTVVTSTTMSFSPSSWLMFPACLWSVGKLDMLRLIQLFTHPSCNAHTPSSS